MPEELSQLFRRVDVTERNHSDLARTVTALTDRLEEVGKVVDELRLDRARREERDLRMNERFDRIEKSIEKGFEDIDRLFAALKKPTGSRLQPSSRPSSARSLRSLSGEA